ncbi:hypothetical protein A3C23_03595 [Candidatus Roizmanbacteria bacterium RIFCSPHIGHO2_02_FULL_37_13b]|uniref:Uncharacterized protein n=1 Tax=Candidatus Roizmanbacteria bacterium RIFCSPLOWO2_02_FULL_36_11 TaxID=1802071 RepID=A0A1F7JBZ9_9BACT|nr:MAG: hypothetical protein A3C23_03595 [Candidatus Roizmanbacteria bacterium RIFCSPHIGHO2_02_FULL_37_13b]OGK53130.1 MAG: hypothetical protein A3H78_01980 [Candidatus Roizmanbacteria bacterium RIFCSPLOWO2_02_FULL_36_11]
MPPTFDSFSFGCRVNIAEKEEIDRQMIIKGFKQTTVEPDIYIINTCSVTQKAEREARQLIYQVRKKQPQTKIVVTGCCSTYWLKSGKYTDLPVDLITDNLQKEYLVQLIKNKLLKNIPLLDGRPKVVDILSDKFLLSGRLLVKIQDGCHRFCSFCIVPYLRGLPKSIPIKEIVNTINHSSDNIKEVVLTAINTEAFGKDSNEGFIELIKSVLKNTKVPRLSFGSVHPWSITNEFIDFYQQEQINNRLVNFFHIPLQSGSNKILTLMKRCHTREDMIDRVKRLASINKRIFISTDIIVGFLEETDNDFKDTYNFLDKSPISKFHVFRFSKREMTAGYYLAKRLKEPDNKTKIERSRLLRELSDEKFEAFQKSLLGYKSNALFLKNTDSIQEVLLDNQVPVYVEKTSIRPGDIKRIEVIKYQKDKLFGRIIK